MAKVRGPPVEKQWSRWRRSYHMQFGHECRFRRHSVLFSPRNRCSNIIAIELRFCSHAFRALCHSLTYRYMPYAIQTIYNSPLHTSSVLITVNKRSYTVYKGTDCFAAETPPHIIYNTNIYLDLPKVINTTQRFGNCSLLHAN